MLISCTGRQDFLRSTGAAAALILPKLQFDARGKLRNNDGAGYANFLGMAGRHQTFHTPAGDLTATGPELLDPVARAFVDAVRKIVERGDAAFGQPQF